MTDAEKIIAICTILDLLLQAVIENDRTKQIELAQQARQLREEMEQ